MSPAQIEHVIASESDLIGIVVCIGDRRSFNTGLIVLDPEVVAARDMTVADASVDAEVRTRVAAAVERGNARLSRVEQLKRHTILGEAWLPGSELMTPTQKVRRTVVDEVYGETIEAMYAA